ncbi:MAG: hypothetical protein EBU46_21360, partial [Nitrosomonadaceae bacterium]|nr:hypothetical protein [Nitrosomonadaceae bacterium]
MATNLSLDPDLIERALEVSGERTKKAAEVKAMWAARFAATRPPHSGRRSVLALGLSSPSPSQTLIPDS